MARRARRLLAAGAADAWLTPILMKKGRPAHTLSVLWPPSRADAVRRVIFTETSTLGLRESPYTKRALARESVTVDVDGVAGHGSRSGRLDGVVVNAQPEYEDVLAAAATLGRPVKAVLAAANAAAQHAGLLPDNPSQHCTTRGVARDLQCCGGRGLAAAALALLPGHHAQRAGVRGRLAADAADRHPYAAERRRLGARRQHRRRIGVLDPRLVLALELVLGPGVVGERGVAHAITLTPGRAP